MHFLVPFVYYPLNTKDVLLSINFSQKVPIVTLARSRKSMKAAEQKPPATSSKKIPITTPDGVPSNVSNAVARPL